MENKKQWHTVKDGKIDRVQVTRENEKPLPEYLEWIEDPPDATLHPETPVERYDTNMCYFTDEEWLKKQGRKDPRGRWYNKKTRDTKLVYGLEETVDETEWTKEAPLEEELFQFFAEANNCWAVDEAKREVAEQENEIARKKAEIAEAEQKRMRSVLAIFDNVANDDDLKISEEYRVKILELRVEIQTLEKRAPNAYYYLS
jgi:hypothetical protein